MDTWKVCLDSLESSGESPSVLSPDEITRAERFHFQRDQKRFVRCRAALRDILGRYLNLPPAGIRFRYQSNGKPELFGL
jgi:4'-phosphopantetheinyl transferase